MLLVLDLLKCDNPTFQEYCKNNTIVPVIIPHNHQRAILCNRTRYSSAIETQEKLLTFIIFAINWSAIAMKEPDYSHYQKLKTHHYEQSKKRHSY